MPQQCGCEKVLNQRVQKSVQAKFDRPVIMVVLGAIAAAIASPSDAADPPRLRGRPFIAESAAVERVVVTLNKSRTFNFDTPFARAIIGAADFADVLPLSDRSIYVQGKKVGTTNLSLIDSSGRVINILDLEVAIDTGNLQDKIRAASGSDRIRVTSSQGQIVLSGVAADAVAADRAVRVAKSLSEEKEVVNAIVVAPSQQVMLEVRFLEVSREGGRQLGVNLFGANAANTQGGRTGFGTITNPSGQSTNTTPSGVAVFETAGSLVGSGAGIPFGTIVARLLSTNNFRIDALVTALEEKGLIRRLAEPNLIALSGDSAKFVAGGEFPVPIASPGTGGIPTVTIEWKEFGVKLNFTPTVLARGIINLRVEPEVSELDFANAVTVGGTLVPALTKRQARTVVELRDGQSFALAGLLASQSTRNISQVPWIGSVPVLGALFRSSAYQQKETDLVIIVTPRLAAPGVPGQRLASPLDSRLPSNDVDFFLNGQPEVKKRYEEFVTGAGGAIGPYGHMIDPDVSVPLPPPPPAKRKK